MTINIELGSDALNEAAWKLLDKIQDYQEVNPLLFNNLKDCLKETIEVYLTRALKEKDNTKVDYYTLEFGSYYEGLSISRDADDGRLDQSSFNNVKLVKLSDYEALLSEVNK